MSDDLTHTTATAATGRASGDVDVPLARRREEDRRALALAREARAYWVEQGESPSTAVAEVDAWLAAHGAAR